MISQRRVQIMTFFRLLLGDTKIKRLHLTRNLFYIVVNGRSSKIYSSWPACQREIERIPQVTYRKFDLIQDANRFSKSVTGSLTYVYVDGSSNNSKKKSKLKGGYGIYYGENDDRNISVTLPGNTSQQAELKAVRHVLSNIIIAGNYKTLYCIRTDCMAIVKALTTLIMIWQKNGWKTSSRRPVKDRDLFEDIKELHDKIVLEYKKEGQEFKVEHVYGHSGNTGNVAANRLARIGSGCVKIN